MVLVPHRYSEDLPAEAMAVGEQLKRKVEAVQETWLVQWFAFLPRCPWLGVKENLAGSDLARAFCWLALSSNLRQHKKQSLQNDLQRLDLRLPPARVIFRARLDLCRGLLPACVSHFCLQYCSFT